LCFIQYCAVIRGIGIDKLNLKEISTGFSSNLFSDACGIGTPILIISHDAEFIEVCAQRVVELRKGGFYEQQE